MSRYRHLAGAANQLGLAEEPSTWFRLVPHSSDYPNFRIADTQRPERDLLARFACLRHWFELASTMLCRLVVVKLHV
jgi:hypothetical protein